MISTGHILKYLLIAILAFLSLQTGCSKQDSPLKAGRVTIDYWDLWTGFELEAIRNLVDKFNRSQDEIYVNALSVSEIERKLLIATAGGDPPDVANLQSSIIPQFADKGALEPLDPLLPVIGARKEDYISIYWKLCFYDGVLYGLPLSPATVALHWNKAIFREFGIDPNSPPQTLEQLDAIAERIAVKKDAVNYETLGFVPIWPGWWNYAWVWWFGGQWWDGKDTITANCPENIAAFEWIRSYAKKYGARSLQNFTSGFGSFSWSDDSFLSNRLAMVLQGVWLSRFIEKFAPEMEWAAAAFPSSKGKLKDVSMAECTVLVIPRGAKHKKEAAKFIGFLQRPENLSYLAMKHNKFVPLKIANEMDYSQHHNKEIKLFIRLSQSKNVHSVPRMPIWQEYAHEIDNAFQSVWLQKQTPQKALDEVQRRVEEKWMRYCDLKEKRKERQ